MEEGGNLWAPGSPRLSFSRDFVQSEVFNPSSSSLTSTDSPDFEFGMLALLRSRDETVAHADELFHNGRILPSSDVLGNPEPPAAAQIVQQEQEQQPQQPPKSPASRRWKEFLSFRRPSSDQPNTGASSSKTSKLKLLFRSSSAGAGRGSPDQSEPALGRSASESKATNIDDPPNASSYRNIVWNLPDSEKKTKVKNTDHVKRRVPKSSPPPVRRALAEVKVGSKSITSAPVHRLTVNHNSPNSALGLSSRQNCLNQGNITVSSTSSNSSSTTLPFVKGDRMALHHGRSSSSSSVDSWRTYSERSSSSSVKVAEVLHMEVCMGQSTVVSKVAKAFMKKENHNHSKIGVTG